MDKAKFLNDTNDKVKVWKEGTEPREFVTLYPGETIEVTSGRFYEAYKKAGLTSKDYRPESFEFVKKIERQVRPEKPVRPGKAPKGVGVVEKVVEKIKGTQKPVKADEVKQNVKKPVKK